jgi:hypothetical protein
MITRICFGLVFFAYLIGMSVVGIWGISIGVQAFERAVIALLALIGLSILFGGDLDA